MKKFLVIIAIVGVGYFVNEALPYNMPSPGFVVNAGALSGLAVYLGLPVLGSNPWRAGFSLAFGIIAAWILWLADVVKADPWQGVISLDVQFWWYSLVLIMTLTMSYADTKSVSHKGEVFGFLAAITVALVSKFFAGTPAWVNWTGAGLTFIVVNYFSQEQAMKAALEEHSANKETSV